MGPSYANFFEVLSNTNFLVSTTAPNLNSTVATLMIASVLPPLPPLIPFARLLNILLDIKISIEGNGLRSSIYYKHTDSHSYLLYSSSRTSRSRIPYLLYCFSDFVAYVVTTLIFRKISGNVPVFDKRGYPVSVVQAGHHCAQQQSAL